MITESRFEKQYLEGNHISNGNMDKFIEKYWYEFNQCYPTMETSGKLYLLKALCRCMIQLEDLEVGFEDMMKKVDKVEGYDLDELYSLLYDFDRERKGLKKVLADKRNTIAILKSVYTLLENGSDKVRFNCSSDENSDYIKYWGYAPQYEGCNDLYINVSVRMGYGGLKIIWNYEAPTLKVSYQSYEQY